MITSIEKIQVAVEGLAGGYERLVLLVGPRGSGKSTALQVAAKARRWPVVNLGLTLSELMLEVPGPQRPARALELVRAIVDEADCEVVCLDNVDLLFEPSLQLDPLAMLQTLSKEKTLVVAWPGEVTSGQSPRLVHAESSHPEYRDYPARGLVLLSVSAE